MLMLYVGAAILAGMAVLLVTFGLTTLVAGRSEVDARLQTYSGTSRDVDEDVDEPNGLAGRFNTFLGDRSFSAGVAASLARAGVKLTVSEYVLIKAAATLLPFVLLSLFHQLLLGILFGGLCSFIPDLWLRRRERKRREEFGLQLPETLMLITGGLRAGFSLQTSMQNVSKQAAEPTASEFNRVTQEIQLGVPLMAALDNLERRIKSEDLQMLISVFKIHSRVGGNLATVLETVGETIRERVKLHREIKVITSMQRISAYVVGALPVFLAMILFVINREYMMGIFHWNIFLCIPVFAGIMNLLGFLVIRKLVDIKV